MEEIEQELVDLRSQLRKNGQLISHLDVLLHRKNLLIGQGFYKRV